jgi:DNA-binding response OmpR family regulator
MTKHKVLLAEDETAIATALKLKLEKENFEVVHVIGGIQALEMLHKESFSVVLLDLIMPDKNGFEVLEELKKEKNRVPVLVLSNLSQEEDIKKAQELGAIDYLIKSDTNLSDIVAYLKTFLKV